MAAVRKTVFVLGAGASIPYGFPSGQDLRYQLCTETLKPGDPRHAILMRMRFKYELVEQFRIALARSWASSIDMFLATRETFMDVGKAAIALTIATYEVNNALFFADPKVDWFRYLWKHLHAREAAKFPASKYAFVTFNYDRSLEHSLSEGISNAYRESIDQASEIMPEIVHVYGSLGKYPYDSVSVVIPEDDEGKFREFATPNSESTTRWSMDSIKIMTEKQPDSRFVRRARELLSNAKQIIFLGFGFDEDNCKLLQLFQGPDCCIKHDRCSVRGTGFGLTEEEADSIQRRFPQRHGYNTLKLSQPDVDCLGFLRKNLRAIIDLADSPDSNG